MSDRHSLLTLCLIVLAIFVAGCAAVPPAGTATPATDVPATGATGNIEGDLVLYSGRSEPLIQPVIDAFRAAYPGVNVRLKAGGNSELANALLEERGNPQADVFVTTEMFTVQALADQEVFAPYRPAELGAYPVEFVGPDDMWVGLTRRARVIMFNKDLVSAEELPDSLLDLTDPRWKEQIAAAGSTNGSMQAQIAVMRQLLGEAETEAWLSGLLANDVTFFGGHTDVRKAVGAGEFKLGLVNHYYYHLQAAEGSNVGVIYPDQGEDEMGLITNATAAAIVRGGANPEAAQAFIDFLVSAEGQRLFAEQNYEYPLLGGIALREGVAPLEDYRLAAVDIAQAAGDSEATFALIEKLGLP
jgi:iron(III) transport system substrate-binding protein